MSKHVLGKIIRRLVRRFEMFVKGYPLKIGDIVKRDDGEEELTVVDISKDRLSVMIECPAYRLPFPVDRVIFIRSAVANQKDVTPGYKGD